MRAPQGGRHRGEGTLTSLATPAETRRRALSATPTTSESPAGADTAPALRCRGIRRSFGETVALDGLDLTVRPGSVVALLGPSGCGKTTALRVIAGLEGLDAGCVEIAGRTVAEAGRSVAPEDRRVGLVFQDYALFPHLNVEQNVAYGLRGLGRETRHDRVTEALTLVGLQGLGQRYPDELSGGQQQRVALARALAPRPALILLDEPFSNLDATLRATVRAEVREILRRAEATAVFVTHDQEEALSTADEVAVMKAGRIHQVASPSVLYQRPADAFVAMFVGDADVLPGRRASNFFIETSLGRLSTTDAVTTSDVSVVIRPEAVTVRPSSLGTATVRHLQYFGHDQLIELELADGTLVRSRQGPDVQVATGDRVVAEVSGSVVTFPA